MMPFHNEDHICGRDDALVNYAGRSGIEPGGRNLKPRPPRKQRFRRRAAQPVAGANKQNAHGVKPQWTSNLDFDRNADSRFDRRIKVYFQGSAQAHDQ
jgi:hypothetical protein